MRAAPGLCRGWAGLKQKQRAGEGNDDPGNMRLYCGEHGNFESRS